MTPRHLLLHPDERQRIHVVGTSGSGKSTLARQLSQRISAEHIELDALHWLANWTEEDPEIFRDKLRQKLTQPSWILDGNYYSKSSDIQWAASGGATAVVWCDFSFGRTLIRALRRAFHRAWTQQEVWPGTGNRESFRTSFFSTDSVVLWTITSFQKNRNLYGNIIRENKYPHIRFVRLQNPRDSSAFLAQF